MFKTSIQGEDETCVLVMNISGINAIEKIDDLMH